MRTLSLPPLDAKIKLFAALSARSVAVPPVFAASLPKYPKFEPLL